MTIPQSISPLLEWPAPRPMGPGAVGLMVVGDHVG